MTFFYALLLYDNYPSIQFCLPVFTFLKSAGYFISSSVHRILGKLSVYIHAWMAGVFAAPSSPSNAASFLFSA